MHCFVSQGESVQERGRDTCVGGEEGERGGEGEEEMFFDAHEISAEEWAKATRAEFTSQSSTGSGRIEGPMSGADDRPPFNETSMEDVGVCRSLMLMLEISTAAYTAEHNELFIAVDMLNLKKICPRVFG